MSYRVDVQNEKAYPVKSASLIQAVEATLVHESVEQDSEITVVITDDDGVRQLNHTYRDIDSPTDVLSFPAGMPTMPGEAPYLGDLIIAFPYAAKQARQENHPVEHSLMALVIHGTLHLLGYDHDTPENRRAMWAVQDTIIAKLGLPAEIVPSLEQHPSGVQTNDT